MRSATRTGDPEKLPPMRFCHTRSPLAARTHVTTPWSDQKNKSGP